MEKTLIVQTTVFLLRNNIYLSQILFQPMFAIHEGMEGRKGNQNCSCLTMSIKDTFRSPYI